MSLAQWDNSFSLKASSVSSQFFAQDLQPHDDQASIVSGAKPQAQRDEVRCPCYRACLFPPLSNGNGPEPAWSSSARSELPS